MGNGMNRVLPGLYVGNYRDSKDASQLERHKITHIIAIHDAARRIHTDKEYLCIMASDSPYQNLSQYFPTCNDFIHGARLQGGNVLIHCLAGMSRSVTIAVAYIMSITSLRWNEALKVVRGARAVSNPNSGFQKQLQDFEATKLPEERRRLQEKFPGTTYFENDEEQCKKLLAAYNNMVLSRAICDGRCATQKVCPTGTCRPHTASPRLGRQKSTDSSISQGSSSSVFSRAGSTKSLDSAMLPEPPGSPRNWERHYGCWKSHFRHRQGTSSTPSTPILYRAARRTDSVTSISSMSSVTSLNNDDGKEAPPADAGGGVGSGPSSIMSRSAILEQNPFLATQSCPNSPRRTPKKVPPPRHGGGFVTTRTSEVYNLVRKNAAAAASASAASKERVNSQAASKVTATSASTTATTTVTTTVTTTTVKTFAKCITGGGGGGASASTGVIVLSARARPSSASAVLSSSSTSRLPPVSTSTPKPSTSTCGPKPFTSTPAPRSSAYTAASKPPMSSTPHKPPISTTVPKPTTSTSTPKPTTSMSIPKPSTSTSAPKPPTPTSTPKQSVFSPTHKSSIFSPTPKQSVFSPTHKSTVFSPTHKPPVSSPSHAATPSSSTSAAREPSSNTSSPLSSPWATPPSSPAHRSPAQLRKTPSAGSKNVTVTASGATRWVMKRSAYKFTQDNS